MKKKKLTALIKAKALTIGFSAVGISNANPGKELGHLAEWLDNGYEGDMSYMKKNSPLLRDPKLLMPEVKSIISVRINYLNDNDDLKKLLGSPKKAYIARYALGRDYHKILRGKLKSLSQYVKQISEDQVTRSAVDSTPVLEKAFAERSGIGWIGKNTNLIDSKSGSFFLLGELLTSIELDYDQEATNHCGTCRKCLDVCPTDAFVGPYQLDARKCISYLTIENKNEIPLRYRDAIGNRIFGCDDCQIYCPWNKFAKSHKDDDFSPRHHLDQRDLIDLFKWSYQEWSEKTLGSAVRRAGYDGWKRNLAIGLGNAPYDKEAIAILKSQSGQHSAMVNEHIQWAIGKLDLRSIEKLNIINKSSSS
jgi:epoxyqueuosine reductase